MIRSIRAFVIRLRAGIQFAQPAEDYHDPLPVRVGEGLVHVFGILGPGCAHGFRSCLRAQLIQGHAVTLAKSLAAGAEHRWWIGSSGGFVVDAAGIVGNQAVLL